MDTGARVAVIDRGKEYSFAEIDRLTRILAKILIATNIPEGDRIAALLPNSLSAVVAFFAATQTGRSYLPLNIGLKKAELKRIFRKCRVRTVVCQASTRFQVPEDIEVIVVDEILADLREGETDTSGKRSVFSLDRPFVCLSTSGSTGTPRIVERTARAVDANIKRLSAGLGITAEDRFLSVVPFWHANGFSNCLLMPLFSGASIITMDRFLPRPMLELIQNSKPTVVVGSPFVFRALAMVVRPENDLSHVRAWISSGAALPTELDEKLRDLNIRIRQLYGSSETGTISISSQEQSRPGNVGKPLPGVRLRLVDNENIEVPNGQSGEVQVSSDSLFSAYVGEPVNKLPITSDGFYRMYDRGERDSEGSLYLTGRIDSMINVAGVKVDPNEIQKVLESMQGICQSLVFGVQDKNGMEIIKTLLVADEGIGTEDVLHYCRQKMAEYKLPRTIEFVKQIPQDLMGKSARRLLEK